MGSGISNYAFILKIFDEFVLKIICLFYHLFFSFLPPLENP